MNTTSESPKTKRIKRVIRWLIGEGVASSQEEVGRILGYGNKSSFSQVVNNEGKMPESLTHRLCALSDRLDADWINTGEGEMLRSGATIKGSNYGVGSVGSMSGGKIELSAKEEYRVILEDNNRLRKENDYLRGENQKLLDQVIKLTDRLLL